MRNKLTAYSVFLLIMLTSCWKADNVALQFTGDYSWVYTNLDLNTFLVEQEFEDDFGIRIKRNGTAILFKNEEVFQKGKIEYFKDLGDDHYSFSVVTDFTYHFTITNGVLRSEDFPVEAIYNEFVKQ